MTETPELPRICAYGPCTNTLPTKTGRGRKFRYCLPEVRTWEPDGKSCKEMAEQARRADRLAQRGDTLTDPVDDLAVATEDWAEDLREAVRVGTVVLDKLDAVADGALAHVKREEAITADALTRVAVAEETAEQAAETARRAVEQRDEAVAARTAAEARATEAVRLSDREISAAHDQVAQAERERGLFEGQATERHGQVKAEIARREAAEKTLAETTAHLRQVAEEAAGLRAGLAAAEAHREAAEELAERRLADATAAGERAAAAEHRAIQADAVRDVNIDITERLRAELATSNRAASSALTESRVHQQNTAHAERRVAELERSNAELLATLTGIAGRAGAEADVDVPATPGEGPKSRQRGTQGEVPGRT